MPFLKASFGKQSTFKKWDIDILLILFHFLPIYNDMSLAYNLRGEVHDFMKLGSCFVVKASH